MLVKSYAAAVQGISATIVTIEVNCTKGIQFFVLGLPMSLYAKVTNVSFPHFR